MKISTKIHKQGYPHSLTNTLKKYKGGLLVLQIRHQRQLHSGSPTQDSSENRCFRKAKSGALPVGSTRRGLTAFRRHKDLDSSSLGLSFPTSLHSGMLSGKQMNALPGLQLLASTGLLQCLDPCLLNKIVHQAFVGLNFSKSS